MSCRSALLSVPGIAELFRRHRADPTVYRELGPGQTPVETIFPQKRTGCPNRSSLDSSHSFFTN